MNPGGREPLFDRSITGTSPRCPRGGKARGHHYPTPLGRIEKFFVPKCEGQEFPGSLARFVSGVFLVTIHPSELGCTVTSCVMRQVSQLARHARSRPERYRYAALHGTAFDALTPCSFGDVRRDAAMPCKQCARVRLPTSPPASRENNCFGVASSDGHLRPVRLAIRARTTVTTQGATRLSSSRRGGSSPPVTTPGSSTG